MCLLPPLLPLGVTQKSLVLSNLCFSPNIGDSPSAQLSLVVLQFQTLLPNMSELVRCSKSSSIQLTCPKNYSVADDLPFELSLLTPDLELRTLASSFGCP